MGSDKNHTWWKGSFPTWLVAGLLGVCGFFLQRELSLNDEYRKATGDAIIGLQIDVTDLKARIGTMENATRENHELLDEISRNLFPWKGP